MADGAQLIVFALNNMLLVLASPIFLHILSYLTVNFAHTFVVHTIRFAVGASNILASVSRASKLIYMRAILTLRLVYAFGS